MTRLVLAVVVLCLLLVVGSVASVAADHGGDNATDRPDPETDVIGWENGYWHNESIDVDQSDGLTDAERDRVLARTMARVEYIRGLEFDETPRIEFVSPEGVRSYVERNVTQLRGGNATWEALFVFGEDVDARRAVREAINANVAGMAAEEGVDHIVLVTENPDRPRLSGFVLAHELVHVLQDQHYDLANARYRRPTLDGELAKDGLVEGEASLVDGRYRTRCTNGEWDCLSGGIASGEGEGNPTVAGLMGVPYQEGATYVAALAKRGGWDAVDAAHDSPPRTMKSVLHPERDVESTTSIEYVDRSGADWDRTDDAQRIGEAGIRTLFDHQNVTRNVPLVVDSGDDTPASAVADGWANDSLFAYANGTHDGYVWVSEWDSEGDARAFAESYRAVLASYDSREVGDSRYVIREGPFADAFDVRRNGTRVRIVNAPDRATLRELDGSLTPVSETPSPVTDDGAATTADRGTDATTDDRPSPTTTGGPGFGVVATGLALLTVALATAARRAQ